MRKYSNIKLLDLPNAKLLAIAGFRKQFDAGVLESKEYVEQLLEQGIMEFDDEPSPTLASIESYIKEYFSYAFEVIKDDNDNNDNNYWIQSDETPDEETQKALDWYALRLPFEKEYIEKIIAWEKRGMTYPAIA
jgi:hypothetical protein